MARNALTDRKITFAKQPGVLIDGEGLRLKVTKNPRTGALRKSWVLRVTVKGSSVREIGLGSYTHRNNTAAARRRADELRDMARQGIDPIAHQKAELASRAADAARVMTFREACEQYIDVQKAGWRNAKHAAQWPATLSQYAYPVFGDVPVSAIDQAMVMKVLDKIWSTKTETAARLRGRIEAVLDWATVRGLRKGDNPARWRGHLEKALPPRNRVRQVKHHPALPYDEMQPFMESLEVREGIAAAALRFVILNACRTSEGIYATWGEFGDLNKATWTIPGARMKSGREHRVPLSAASVELLQRLRPANPKPGDFVFPAPRGGKPLSNMALLALLKRMGRSDLTTHGFRSTFRDWAAERTNFPNQVAEAALAHVVGDQVEAAYRRGDLFEKRRKLMEAWSAFCAAPPIAGRVLNLRQGAA